MLTMAAAALMMAACSADEIASVAQKPRSMRSLEIVPVVRQQTRADQITTTNITAFTVHVTGKFFTEEGTQVDNPVLSMTKSNEEWSYTYNNGTAAVGQVLSPLVSCRSHRR